MRQIIVVLILVFITSCSSTKRVNRVKTKEVESVSKNIDTSINYRYEGAIKTVTIQEPVFIDSSGVSVRAVRTVIFEDKVVSVDSVVVSKEEEKSESSVVSLSFDKNVKRTNYTGLVIFLVLLATIIFYLRRLFKI